MDTLRENQKEVLEIKNTQIEMENAFDGPVDSTCWEEISELE